VALCKSADVVVAPPFIYIDQVKNSLTGRLRFLLRMCGLEKEEPTLEILGWVHWTLSTLFFANYIHSDCNYL
jgi:hypothetical protein